MAASETVTRERTGFQLESFEWSDPEGNVWEVTWAEGTSFDEREALIFP